VYKATKLNWSELQTVSAV